MVFSYNIDVLNEFINRIWVVLFYYIFSVLIRGDERILGVII